MSEWHSWHFNKVAKMIRERRPIADERETSPSYHAQVKAIDDLLDEMTLAWSRFFTEQSPSFDANKFIKQCGYEYREWVGQ